MRAIHRVDFHADQLEAAIARGRAALARAQRPDGSFEGETDLGPVGAAMHWIVRAQLGGIPADEAAAGARYLLAQQHPDGSFPPYPGAHEGTASATALCRAGLRACRLPHEHPALVRAMAFVDARGGHAEVTAGL